MAKKTADIEIVNALGFRRICPSCGTKYYDMNKQPPTCPTCQAMFDPEGLVRTRRRALAAEKETPETDDEDLPEDDLPADDVDIEADETEEEGEEDLIEDASELEGDDDLIVEIENEDEES